MPRPRPTIRHYPKKPPKPPVETDLKALGDAANEAAKREAAQWFFFLTIMITLAALVGSTTHRVLFLEDPVRVPILSVELPLLGFYVAAPAIFVVMHFYLLAQLQLMAAKVNAFLDAVERETPEGSEHRELALRRLDSFSVAQRMAADRFGNRSFALWLMVVVTLVLAPLVLLLFFQIRFLPHHTELITLWHQLLVTADVVILWWLWPFPQGEGARWRRIGLVVTGSLAVLGISWILAVIPGEDPQSGGLNAIRAPLFDGPTHEVTQRATSPFTRRLILLDEVFLTEAERKTWTDTPEERRDQIGRTRVLRGRDLRFAELSRADLRGADLTGGILRGANLAQAEMQGAVLTGAKLQGANLSWTQLQGADLRKAEMQGADLSRAHLNGANLFDAQMQGVNLIRAEMQGAFLPYASMQGALLTLARMQGADLSFAVMRGANLRAAEMQGVDLSGSQMWGVDLSGSHMQGADVWGTEMQGAELGDFNVWMLLSLPADTSDASLNRLKYHREPPCSERFSSNGSCVRYGSWAEAVKAWLLQIPHGARRNSAQRRLSVLLEPKVWEETEGATGSLTPTDTVNPSRVADLLGRLACGAEHPPHMARGVIAQIGAQPPHGRDLGPHRATLAARMLSPDCPGAQGLRPEERAQLARIAAGQN